MNKKADLKKIYPVTEEYLSQLKRDIDNRLQQKKRSKRLVWSLLATSMAASWLLILLYSNLFTNQNSSYTMEDYLVDNYAYYELESLYLELPEDTQISTTEWEEELDIYWNLYDEE